MKGDFGLHSVGNPQILVKNCALPSSCVLNLGNRAPSRKSRNATTKLRIFNCTSYQNSFGFKMELVIFNLLFSLSTTKQTILNCGKDFAAGMSTNSFFQENAGKKMYFL